MTRSNPVAGGEKPTRHRKFVRPRLLAGPRKVVSALGGAVLVGLAVTMVFLSGYLLGSNGTHRVQTATTLPAALPAADLPAPPADKSRPAEHRSKNREHHSKFHQSKSQSSKPKFVTVHEGDTLTVIAESVAPHKDPYVTVQRIIKLNSFEESETLSIGQRIKVPGTATSSRHKPPEHAKSTERASRRVARPVSVDIPALGLRQDLVELNVIGGTLQVPTDYGDVGWWRDGPAPGAPGSAVLVGHVDSPTGPAVFYTLSALKRHDEIKVGRADGTTATFRVTDATLYPRESFPSARVYRKDGKPVLTLVTCGGTYDRTAGHYTGNLVVTAHLVHGNG